MFGKKNKLNLLIVSQYFWPENFRINDLALFFAKKGHNVTVLTGYPNYPEGLIYPKFKENKKKFDNYKKIKIYRAPIIPRGKNKITLLLNYLSFVLSSIYFVLFELKKKNFDIVFTAQYSPVFVAFPSILISKLNNIKHLMWVQDLWPETLLDLKTIRKGYAYSLLKKIVRYIFQNTDLIFVQSKGFIKIIKKNYNIKNIKYLPNWPEDIFARSRRKTKTKSKKQFNIVFTGNIGKAQDFDNIIKAALILKKYDKIYWNIYGGGSELSAAKQKLKSLDLDRNFTFHGNKPLNAMPRVMEQSDILIITMIKSKFLNKTIPGKFQSYLASSKPIVGMIDGVTNKIIKDSKIGLVSSSGNYQSFAKNILKFYKLKSHMRGKYQRKVFQYYFANFNKNKILNNLQCVMRELAK